VEFTGDQDFIPFKYQGQYSDEETLLLYTSSLLEGDSAVLDVAGFIPVIGTFADVANAGISLARGNYMDAAMNLVGAVPVVGDAAKASYHITYGVHIHCC